MDVISLANKTLKVTVGHFWPFSKLSKHSQVGTQNEALLMRQTTVVMIFKKKQTVWEKSPMKGLKFNIIAVFPK